MKFASAVLCLSGFFAAWGQQADVRQTPHVIIIGVDGLSVEGVTTAKTPRIHELMARGAWTLEARGVMPTLSSPNWASMITGAGPEQHGITSNGVLLQKMVTLPAVCRDAEGMFPTMFEVLRMQSPASHIAIFHDWPGFADLVEKHAPDVMQHERGADRTTRVAIDYWKQKRPELMFVHLDNVDHTGHEYGWGSHEYNKAVADADGYLGEFVDMLREQGAQDSTYVLVTSDHGGKGREHGKNSLQEIQIPWILVGPGVMPGRVAASVYTFDTAATVAWIFDVNPPDCWIGRPVISVFAPAMTAARNLERHIVQGNCGPQRTSTGIIAWGLPQNGDDASGHPADAARKGQN
ncbi:MAG: ectonucleotide pyrophosphatase/phosphodiesterase [Candidatus Sulfopaludibacter sp.]|nr:ectonucleotide pyrophosphatase/phosphodiesterase [Candidatus Sulfopaludibacter sp.]